MKNLSCFLVKVEGLPDDWPTHSHNPEFWVELGRTIATYGFLEETLGKAIFALTATKEYSDDAVAEALEKWLPKLKGALSNTLGHLIDVYAKSVREHQSGKIENFDELEENLREAAQLRNVLCHGSWRRPDENGASVPFFVNRQMEVFASAVDVPCLKQTRKAVVELICAVVNTVSHMGYQFPGTAGPGKQIWPSR